MANLGPWLRPQPLGEELPISTGAISPFSQQNKPVRAGRYSWFLRGLRLYTIDNRVGGRILWVTQYPLYPTTSLTPAVAAHYSRNPLVIQAFSHRSFSHASSSPSNLPSSCPQADPSPSGMVSPLRADKTYPNSLDPQYLKSERCSETVCG